MTPEKIKKWKENREAALDLYRTTDMNITQIARALRISVATADKMITGKNLPKFITEEKKEVPMDIKKDDSTLSALEEEIVKDAYDQITNIMLLGNVFVKDSTNAIIKSIITKAVLKGGNLAREEVLKAMKDVEHEVHRILLKFAEKVG